MSAFALRKRLLASQEESASSSESGSAPEPASLVAASILSQQRNLPKAVGSRQKRARKSGPSGTASPTKKPSSIRDVSILEENFSVLSPVAVPVQLDAGGVNTPPLEIAPVIAPPKTPATVFSTYIPTKTNCQRKRDGTVLITLLESERLVVLGSYGIRVKSGKITINGAALSPLSKILWVDAPQCYALPVIRVIDDATFELRNHTVNGDLRRLAYLTPMFRGLFFDDDEYTYKIASTSLDGPKKAILQDLVSPPEWNREMSRLSKSSSIRPITTMVTGPKSSGKSTFGKMLANRVLTEPPSLGTNQRTSSSLAVLDLDPGQPEYGVPGQISLVHIQDPVSSPSFSRPLVSSMIRTIRSHTLASISPASDPELYLEAAKDLYTHYKNAVGSSPLIINTPGWIQGTGLDLLAALITDLRPTEVVYMSQTGPSDTVEGLQLACKNSTFTMLPSQTASIASRTAAQLRSMQLMCYFHAEATSDTVKDSSSSHSWITQPLTTIPPWQVNYASGPSNGISGILCYDYQASPSLLADAINGNILAIVVIEDHRAFRDLVRSFTDQDDEPLPAHEMDIDNSGKSQLIQKLLNSLTRPTPEGLPYLDTSGTTLDPQYSRCIGLALVRGIDVANETLQLLTPITEAEVDQVFTNGEDHQIVLVSGKFDTPSWAYTQDFYYQQHRALSETYIAPGSSAVSQAEREGDEDEDDDEMIQFEDDEPARETISESVASKSTTSTPWIEELRGSQKRGIGAKVWRVRRDLGRSNNAAD